MPSLQALESFRSSFSRLGGELATLEELELTPDVFPLPDSEPAASPGTGPAVSAEADSGPAVSESADSSDLIDFGDLSDLIGGMDSPAPDASGGNAEELPVSNQDDIDFGNFIDTIPDDFAGEPDEESASETPGVPPDLLNGFADEIEAERSSAEEDTSFDTDFPDIDFPAEPASEPAFDDNETFGDEFADIDLDSPGVSGESPPDQEPDTEILADFPDFDSGERLELPGEEGPAVVSPAAPDSEDGELSGESFADFDLPDESPGGSGDEDFTDADFADTDFANTDLGDAGLAGMDFPGESSGDEADIADDVFGAEAEAIEPAADLDAMDLSGGDDGFDLGGESSDFDTDAVLEEISGDSFDNFRLDTNIPGEKFDPEAGDSNDFGSELGSLDDFAFATAENVFSGKSAPARAGKAPAAGEMKDEVEEINLSDEDFDLLQKTLSSYPLNLRIVCEELIAEEAVAPALMSQLVKLLVDGASAAETAKLAGKITDRVIPIPKGFEKKTGEALEAEQSSFSYIFVHNFLPVFRLFLMVAMVLLCTGYLCWMFIYTPLKAEKIYRLGIERIEAGEYGRANERFREAFAVKDKKPWFYTYARAFREARQYTLAEEKYRELLYYTASKNKRNIPDKAAVLEYADLETNVIGNYEAADIIIRRNILDYSPADRDALLALGDNSLAWGEFEPSRLEDARESYAKIMERYGRSDPLLERMLKYFIRTDNLEEVLPLQSYFMSSEKRKISAAALAEMGGYFLDKRFETVRGVPNEYLGSIGGIREILLRAVRQDSMLPESYYHLARYYNYYDNTSDERLTLDLAVRVFEAVREESPKRIKYHINTLYRYSEILAGNREFFPAEESLIKGINLYQDGLSRRLLSRSPEFGRLYTALGDLEYFVKDGDMRSALDYYRLGERNGWAPPEIQYRMGAAHYQLREWGPALDRLFAAYREISPNRRILYALGNVSYMRGNFFAAQGYYDRLLEILEADRGRLPPIAPTDDESQLDLAERLMVVQNNLGVTLEALTERTGSNRYRARAQGLYSDSARAWDVLTRNPGSLVRMRPSPDISAPGVNPAYLNVQNNLHPVSGYEPQFFMRIDKDVLEQSHWEDLAPPGYRLSEGINSGR